MGTAGHDRERNQAGGDSGASTESGRKWGRILIPLGVLVVVLGILTYILVVSQRGAEDESKVYGDQTGSAAVVIGEFERGPAPV